MRQFRRLIWVITATALVAGAALWTEARPPRIEIAYGCEIEPLSYDPVSGRVQIEVTLEWQAHYPGHTTCDDLVTIRIEDLDGLEYSGPPTWEVLVERGAGPVKRQMEVTVPPNDTSGFNLVTACGEYRFNWHRYFITSGDSIEAVWSDPREWIRIGQPMPEEELIRLSNIEFQKLVKEQQANREPPPQGHGSYHPPLFSPEDSALADSLTPEELRQLARMRRKEKEPLVGAERELAQVGHRWFVRLEGETRFHRAPAYTQEEWKQLTREHWKALKEDPEGHRYRVILNLRDAADYEKAVPLVDSLEPTADSGFYQARVTKAELEQLYNMGIRYLSDWSWPWEKKGKR